MRKILLLIVAAMAGPSHAQGLLGAMTDYQKTLEAGSTSNSKNEITSGVKLNTESSAVSSGICTENDQISLPLSYITGLIQNRNAQLDVAYDPRSGVVNVSADSMISNCNSMLDWKIGQREIGGKNAHVVEAKIKKVPSTCNDKGLCTYKVAKLKNGAFEFEEMEFKPTMAGFEDCLIKSGAFENKKVHPAAIYSAPLDVKLADVVESGDLYFVSHGPASAPTKAKYSNGKFLHIDRCDYYEAIHPNVKYLRSYDEEESLLLRAQADDLKKNCTANDYHRVSNFLEKYVGFSAELGEVRDRLILEAVKKSAEAIGQGKATEENFKVIGDFDKYLVQPAIQQAVYIYERMLGLDGDEKVRAQEELKTVLSKLNSYGVKPNFTLAHVKKLEADGRFDQAEKINNILLHVDSYKTLGSRLNNIVVTPDVAQNKVINGIRSYKTLMTAEQEKYEIRTGQSTGQAELYMQLANRMRHNIQVRSQNFMQEISEEHMRLQPPMGYCTKWFRNYQKCAVDTMERIQELQHLLQHYNKVDLERSVEYEKKSKEFGDLEAQGRKYIAKQNGEEVVEGDLPSVANLSPSARNQNGVYSFDYPGQQMQPQGQQQMMNPQMFQQQNPVGQYMQPNMFQQQQNPFMQQNHFQNFQQQQPWMGQQAFSPYGYQSQMGMNNGFMWPGSQQQPPWGQQPMWGQQPLGQQPMWGQQPMGQQPWMGTQGFPSYNMYGYR